jgi:WD40 repeat protein
MAELDAALSALPCRHLLAVLDCCFAGAFRWSSTRDLIIGSERLPMQRYRWFIQGQAWQAIASAAYDEKARDVAAERVIGKRDEDACAHSPFASAMIEGLKGAADLAPAGATGDGVITATELFLYIEQALKPPPGTSHLPQTPIFWPLAKHRKGEFVFLVPDVPLSLPDAPALDLASNPWRGLRPYETSDAKLFFGRTKAADALRDRVLGRVSAPAMAAENFIVVTGPSGIGKSSLVRAGLLPRLTAAGMPSIVVQPGASPFASLAAGLHADERPGNQAPNEEALENDPESLATWMKRRGLQALVIDQAEELITMATPRRQEHPEPAGARRRGTDLAVQLWGKVQSGFSRKPAEPLEVQPAPVTSPEKDAKVASFLQLIANALDTCPDLRVIFAVRADYEPQFSQYPLAERWDKALFPVPQMTQDELRRVIEGPAAVKVVRFENEELVERLVNEVVVMPGALPVLSFALSGMYESYIKRSSDDRTLTWEDYGSLEGGIPGALRVRANKVVDSLDAQHQQTIRRVLERLVSIEAGEFARRRVPRTELDADEPAEDKRVERVIGDLVAARLLIADVNIELAHDAIILAWDRLMFWIRQDSVEILALRRLTQATVEWQSARSDILWDKPAQVEILKKLQRLPFPGLNGSERQFVEASIRRAKSNQRIRRMAVTALVLLFFAASGFAWFWYSERNLAQENLVQTQISQSRFLADRARTNLHEGSPVPAALLGLAALPDKAGGIDRPLVSEIEPIIYDALQETHETAWLVGHNGVIHAAAFSPDAARVVTASNDNTGRLWDGNTGTPLATLTGHNAQVVGAAYSPEGTRVATASLDRTARVWDANTGAQLAVLHHTDAVESVAFSPDGRRIVTASGDRTARIWDAQTGAAIATLTGHENPVRTAAFSPDGKRVLTVPNVNPGDSLIPGDTKVRLWEAATGRLLCELKGHDDYVNNASFSHDGGSILTVSEDKTARVWETMGCAQTSMFKHNGRVLAGALSPDGSKAVTVSADETVARIWDTRTANELTSLSGHSNWVVDASFSPDGATVVTASSDKTARLWDARTGAQLAVFKGHQRAVKAAAFSFDGSRVMTTSDDDVRVWDTKYRGGIIALEGHSDEIKSIAFSVDGSQVLTSSYDGTARLWNSGTGASVFIFRHGRYLNSAVFSHDGTRVLTTSGDQTARLWDTKTGAPLSALTGHKDSVIGGEFSRDDTQIVTVDSGAARVWDATTGKLTATLDGHEEPLSSAAFSSDGTRILTVSRYGVRIWNAKTGAELLSSSQRDDYLEEASFSPDATLVVLAYRAGARLMDATTGHILHVLPANESRVEIARFSPDGAFVLTSYWSGPPTLRNSKTGVEVGALRGHDDGLPLDTVFSQDGSLVLTTAWNGAARIWDLKSRDLSDLKRRDLIASLGTATKGAFSADGKRAATADGNKAYVWPVYWPTEELIRVAKTRVHRCLTRSEREAAFLAQEPPRWCITGSGLERESDPAKWQPKWPYQTRDSR